MSEEDKKTEEAQKEESEKEEPKAEDKTVKVGKDEEKEARPNDEVGQVEVPKEFKTLIEQIEKMSVLELSGLVKVLEKKFGVSAAAVAAPASALGAGADSGGEEQDSFTVELKDAGGQKIAIIKVVKEILGLGLKEAKDLVDSAPAVLKEGVKKEEAEEIKKKVEGAGGKAELK